MSSNIEIIEVIDLTDGNINYIDLTQPEVTIDLTNEIESQTNSPIYIPENEGLSTSASAPSHVPNPKKSNRAWYDNPNASHPFELALKGKAR